jgi:hypothetical protein
MSPASRTIRLNWMYPTASANRGQTVTSWPTTHQAGGTHLAGPPRRRQDLRKELRRTDVLEAIMAGAVVTIAIAVFLGGVMVGVLAVVAIAVRREDRRYTLADEAPDRLSRNTRRLTGVGRRGLDAEFFPLARELVR